MTKAVATPQSATAKWVQTERDAHEAWAALIGHAPKAAQLMYLLASRVGQHNAVVVSQKNLMKLMGCSRRTVQRALGTLCEDGWLEVRQIGENGTVNAYIINDRVAWTGRSDDIRHSRLSAAIILSSNEQPDQTMLDDTKPLRRMPSLFQRERNVLSSAGLSSLSPPFLEDMGPDLPSGEESR